MKLNPPRKLTDIAKILGCEFSGSPDHLITGLNEINKVEEGDVVFVDHPKYYDKALNSKATTIIINRKVEAPKGKALLFSEEPFTAFNKLITHFSKISLSQKTISDTAVTGKGTVIMPGSYVGDHVTIGSNCIIHPNVSIYHNCVIGNNVIIHSGSVIGADAFYYKKRSTGFEKLISCGRVIIEDQVEIGALCTIDRGVTGDTVIGESTKIDNQCQVGHDTVIGKRCLFASQVGISGACIIEDDVTLWGQVGVPSKLRIGKGAVVLGQSGLTKSLEGGKTYFGSPAAEAMEKMRELALIKRLPEIVEKLK